MSISGGGTEHPLLLPLLVRVKTAQKLGGSHTSIEDCPCSFQAVPLCLSFSPSLFCYFFSVDTRNRDVFGVFNSCTFFFFALIPTTKENRCLRLLIFTC